MELAEFNRVVPKSIYNRFDQIETLRMHFQLRTRLLGQRPIPELNEFARDKVVMLVINKIIFTNWIEMNGYRTFAVDQCRCRNHPVECWRLFDRPLELEMSLLTKVNIQLFNAFKAFTCFIFGTCVALAIRQFSMNMDFQDIALLAERLNGKSDLGNHWWPA